MAEKKSVTRRKTTGKKTVKKKSVARRKTTGKKTVRKVPTKKVTQKRKRHIEMEVDLNILAIDSNYDHITRVAYEYRQQRVYPYLESQGFSILRCQGQLARRIYVAPDARRNDIVYMTGVGHGLYTTYTGDYNDYIFDVGKYRPEEANGKVVHFLSCQTAAILGQDFVLNGCRAYFGYDENFVFLEDFSDIFFECDSVIDFAFANGLTAKEVYDRTIALYDLKIADMENMENEQYDYVACVLKYDRNHLRAPSVSSRWGDLQATIV